MKENFLIVDGNWISYCAYYASSHFKNQPTTSGRVPTAAVLVVHNMIMRTINQIKPSFIFVAFDEGSKTFRHEQFPDYKVNRKSMPEDLVIQIPIIRKLISKLGINHRSLEKIEGDDLMAEIALKASLENQVFIMSADADLQQLIRQNISVIKYSKGQLEIINELSFKAKYGGLKPSQLVDYKAIVGDSSDNLPGIRNVGPKTAVKLLNEHGDLETIYENLNQLSPRLRNLFLENKKNAFLTRKLVNLQSQNKKEFLNDDLAAFRYYPEQVNVDQLISFYYENNLNSLVQRLEK